MQLGFTLKLGTLFDLMVISPRAGIMCAVTLRCEAFLTCSTCSMLYVVPFHAFYKKSEFIRISSLSLCSVRLDCPKLRNPPSVTLHSSDAKCQLTAFEFQTMAGNC